jgi:hypothetical protein
VFGMGTGGTSTLWSPEILWNDGCGVFAVCVVLDGGVCCFWCCVMLRWMSQLNIHQVSRPISTGPLRVLPRFHFRPINVLVLDGTLGRYTPERSYLGVGFPLRCFQRLSDPFMATRRCPWQDNRNTRGTFDPVLSY